VALVWSGRAGIVADQREPAARATAARAPTDATGWPPARLAGADGRADQPADVRADQSGWCLRRWARRTAAPGRRAVRCGRRGCGMRDVHARAPRPTPPTPTGGPARAARGHRPPARQPGQPPAATPSRGAGAPPPAQRDRRFNCISAFRFSPGRMRMYSPCPEPDWAYTSKAAGQGSTTPGTGCSARWPRRGGLSARSDRR
jgi:hypothetical protein